MTHQEKVERKQRILEFIKANPLHDIQRDCRSHGLQQRHHSRMEPQNGSRAEPEHVEGDGNSDGSSDTRSRKAAITTKAPGSHDRGQLLSRTVGGRP